MKYSTVSSAAPKFLPMLMNAVLPVFFLASAISATAFAGTPGEIEVGSILPEATLRGFSGNTAKFSDYRGKPLLINVWASWCGPCRAEMGSLDRLARRYNGKQFNIIGISTDDNGIEAAAFIRKSQTSFVNYLDRRVFLENMLGANTIPLTVLIDANGRILDKAYGAREWDSPEIVEAIERAFQIKLPH